MNQKFIQNTVLSSLVFGVLALGVFNANATDYNQQAKQNSKTISSNEFYNILEVTEANDVAKTFGVPDSTATLTDSDGDTAGVVWTYQNAVSKENTKFDANLVFVAGVFKYATLSGS